MGNTFAMICICFIKRLFVEERAHGTQTNTKFTERLTNFDEVDLGSDEIFDQACNICDLYTGKEAVGYCIVCEQYMCYQCCKHHEKIFLSQNHKIVGKEDFGQLKKEKSLFDLHLVPLTTGRLPSCIHGDYSCPGTSSMFMSCDKDRRVLATFSLQNSRRICFLMSSKYGHSDSLQLGAITHNSAYKRFTRSEDVMSSKNATIKYFVMKSDVMKSEIWMLKCNNDNFFYKFVFNTSGECHGVVLFDNGLAVLVYIQTGYSLPDWQIQYLDFRGNLKRQIYYDSKGNQLFKSPDHLASNEDILFVTDIVDNSVVALDPEGNVIYKFKHDSIKYPTGIACDEENNIYVVCNSKVIQIDEYGKVCRILLDSKSKAITDLHYDNLERRLAVIEEKGSVKIFAFLP